jgi:hypothetical protein
VRYRYWLLGPASNQFLVVEDTQRFSDRKSGSASIWAFQTKALPLTEFSSWQGNCVAAMNLLRPGREPSIVSDEPLTVHQALASIEAKKGAGR